MSQFIAGIATGWIGCLALLAAIWFVALYVIVTGRLPWPRRTERPGEE